MMTGAIIRRHQSLCSSEQGATAVETAIVFTALMLLIFGILQFAQIFWAWNTIWLAIEEGGRFAMINSTQNPNAGSCPAPNPLPPGCAPYRFPVYCVPSQINNILSSYPSPASSPNAFTASLSCSGATLTIQGTFTFNFIGSTLFPYGPIILTSQYTVPLS
jgi:hypothetical protein